MIRKGETERFCFMLTKDDLCIIDRNMNRVVEPGNFKIMIGSSSDNIRLETMMTVK